MKKIKAEKVSVQIVCKNDNAGNIIPLIRNESGTEIMYGVSPIHGRSFVLQQASDDKWIIGKGNGLGYSSHPFLNTSHVNGDTWGALPLENAVRDFNIGNEVASLGIKTNRMEYVLDPEMTIIKNGEKTHGALLQYTVECPYRISDFGFIPKHALKKHVSNWEDVHQLKHLYAAEVLSSNLRILHQHHILHNAIHPQNYTWALELLDFEASRSDKYPYNNKEYERFVPLLEEMEIIQTYEIVNYIAWCLSETPDYKELESIFNNNGFELTNILNNS